MGLLLGYLGYPVRLCEFGAALAAALSPTSSFLHPRAEYANPGWLLAQERFEQERVKATINAECYATSLTALARPGRARSGGNVRDRLPHARRVDRRHCSTAMTVHRGSWSWPCRVLSATMLA
jgi:hypothetical protein